MLFVRFIISVLQVLLQHVFPNKHWKDDSSLRGKTVVITGGSSGIGLATVRILTSRGARLVIGCRDTVKTAKVLHGTLPKDAQVSLLQLDLASFTSVRSFAKRVLDQEKQIHVLINNAGISSCPETKSEDGMEMQFQVNYLGHFLLTQLLMKRLTESAPARVVNLSSIVHFLSTSGMVLDDVNMEKKYNPLTAYVQSKLAIVLFTAELAKRLQGSGVTTYSVHPGAVDTNAYRYLDAYIPSSRVKSVSSALRQLFFTHPNKGAQTTVFCATEGSLANESGCYYSGCRRWEPSFYARDANTAEKLWKLSSDLTCHFVN